MTEHSKGPWFVDDQFQDCYCIPGRTTVYAAPSPEDAAHIVACHNALAGLKPECMPELVAICEHVRDLIIKGGAPGEPTRRRIDTVLEELKA